MKTELPMITKRECGTCTKCCEGHLMANVRGRDVGPGKPCIFVEIGKGCKEYDKRPKDPCKSFTCGWLDTEEIPEEFKPDKSGVIFTFRTTDELKIPYMGIHSAPNDPSSKILTWAFINAASKPFNLVWELEKKGYYFGTADFCKEMKKVYA